MSNSESDRIIGQVRQTYGNSCFSVLPVGDNSEIKAKLIGNVCDMRYSSKGKNKITKGNWVIMTETDYKLNGGIKYLIYQKLDVKEGKKFQVKSTDADLKRYSDILDLSIDDHDENIDNYSNEDIDIDNL